ncbi:MAG: hypothetical protein ACYC9J_12475 [Sulfuricaulis sp.]
MPAERHVIPCDVKIQDAGDIMCDHDSELLSVTKHVTMTGLLADRDVTARVFEDGGNIIILARQSMTTWHGNPLETHWSTH